MNNNELEINVDPRWIKAYYKRIDEIVNILNNSYIAKNFNINNIKQSIYIDEYTKKTIYLTTIHFNKCIDYPKADIIYDKLIDIIKPTYEDFFKKKIYAQYDFCNITNIFVEFLSSRGYTSYDRHNLLKLHFNANDWKSLAIDPLVQFIPRLGNKKLH